MASHNDVARRLGTTEQWLAALRRETPESEAAAPGSEEGLEPGWIGAPRYAESVNRDGHRIGDTQYERLTR
jgi:hypothetical protein